MHKLIVVVLLLFSLSAVAADRANDTGPVIRVLEGDWGDARTNDIETVLHSVAAVLLEHFPRRPLPPILVARSPNHPLTLYKRGPNNEYRVLLTAKNSRWAYYTYEFAHELCHILTNYEHHAYSNLAAQNQWFEESLCEVASLFALKRLAYTWEASPPHPHWAAYAPEFERYAQRILDEQHRRLPAETSLAAWFQKSEKELRGNPYLRGHNEIVANLLLPLFEENPQLWEATGYLNLEAEAGDFRQHMRTWHSKVPESYKDIVSYVMALFGIAIGDAASADASRATPASLRAVNPGGQGVPATGPSGSASR